MPRSRSKSRAKKPPKRVLALPDLEHAKAAVLNSLTSASGQRTYDHAIPSSSPGTARSRGWRSTAPSCSAIASTSSSATTRRPPSICGSRPSDAWPTKRPMPGSSVRNWRRAFVA